MGREGVVVVWRLEIGDGMGGCQRREEGGTRVEGGGWRVMVTRERND